MNTNLLEETCEALSDAGRVPNDVAWVGSRGGVFAIGWTAFAMLRGALASSNLRDLNPT